jgi:hypothetical protein
MADKKISQLTAKGTPIAATDLVEISESNGVGGYVTKSVTGANILASKQDTLVSGTNIKTINGSSVLGSGNLVVTPGVASLTATAPVVATGTSTPDISLASGYGDTLNPYASKTANHILAAPNGTAGVPTFRAMVASDVPTLNQSTTGNAATVTTNANLTGPVTSIGNATAIANGAISNAMLANGAVANLSGTNTGDNATNSQYSGLVSNATHTGDAEGNFALTVKGINNTILSNLNTGILKNTTGTGVPSIAVAADFPILNQNTTGTAGSTATLATARTISMNGDVLYTSPAFDGSANVLGTATLASIGVAGTYTKVTTDAKGRVTVGANITAGDVPTLNQNTTGTADNVTGIVAVANGGTGTATPSLVAGTNVTITGTFPNQTIAASGGGGGGGGFHMLSPTLPGILYLAQAYTPNVGSTSLSNGVNYMMMSLFAPATTFTITELSVNVITAASSASNVKILVYSDDGFGYPRAKLIESSALSMTTTGGKTFLTSYTFTAGTRYWMGVITDSSAGAVVTGLSSNVLYMRNFNYNIMLSGYYIAATFATPPALNTSSAISSNLQTAAVFVRT